MKWVLIKDITKGDVECIDTWFGQGPSRYNGERNYKIGLPDEDFGDDKYGYNNRVGLAGLLGMLDLEWRYVR